MAGPSLVGIHDRRVAERREVRAPLAVPLHPRHAVILIGPRAELAETPAESAIRFLDVDAHQHALLLARVGRGWREHVELVGVRERLAAERLHERARRIVDLEHLLLDAVLPGPAAHHVGELRPVQVGVRHGVVAAETAAFAHEAQDALAHLGIVVHHAAHVVEEHRVEFLDLRILQQLLIVAERRLECAGVLRHQLDHVVAVRNRAVAGIHLDVGDEQLARTCRLRRRPGAEWPHRSARASRRRADRRRESGRLEFSACRSRAPTSRATSRARTPAGSSPCRLRSCRSTRR